MEFDDETLSAFLDGELSPSEMTRVEEALAADTDLQDRLEALMATDDLVRMAYDDELQEPMPPTLVSAIEAAPGPAANEPQAPSRSGLLVAASVAGALVVGGLGGFFAGSDGGTGQVAATGGWLADIADYHAVYAKQVRHLVEVPASEADHIQTWLTNTVGAPVRIPDLAMHDLTFEGARLLVAAGKPVAQLIYTDPDKGVVALCLIASPSPQEGFASRTINAFDMVSWGGDEANYVIVGDTGRADLQEIAQTAAIDV